MVLKVGTFALKMVHAVGAHLGRVSRNDLQGLSGGLGVEVRDLCL